MIDLNHVGAICQSQGLLFVVDASQSAGIFPIHMQEMIFMYRALQAIKV